MAPNDTPKEPQSAAEYDDRTTAAVKSVLVEIGQILAASRASSPSSAARFPGCCWPTKTCLTLARWTWMSGWTRKR